MSGISLLAVSMTIASSLLLGGAAALYRWRRRRKCALRQAPGSRIAIAAGEGFMPSDRFAGFVHEKSGALVTLMELPPEAFGPLQELEAAKQAFEEQGVSGVAVLPLPGRSGEYVYLRGEQNTALVEYAKYGLIFREGGAAGMVAVSVPRVALNAGIVTGAQIERILVSAIFLGSAEEAHPLFTLPCLGPFEEDASLLGTAKGYRLKAEAASSAGEGLQPLFLVAPSLSGAPIADPSVFAESSFHRIDQIRDKTLETLSATTIAGLPAVEAVGHGTDAATGEAALVYQLIVQARDGGYFRLIGLAPEDSRDQFLTHFRKMAASFSPS
jgi:hypothetical protein